MRYLRISSAMFLSASLAAHAQAKLQSLNFIQPTGKGRIVIPLSDQRRWQRVTFVPANDFSPGGPSIFLHDTPTKLEIVYSLSGNHTHSAKDCLDSAMEVLEKGLATGSAHADIKPGQKSEATSTSGQPMLTGSFLVTAKAGAKTSEQHVYAVVASRDTCAEIQVEKTDYSPADDAAIQAALQTVNLDVDYAPVSTDYFLMATLITQLSQGRGFLGSAAYDQRALDTLPADAPAAIRRILIDRLSTAYARSGQAEKSRAANEAAIKTDADYPMYYYNLARVDAEDFKAAEAKAHLQQAWDRKANLPATQQMPDPTQDPSLQKLKAKADFWTYVQGLK